jgi:DNA-binding MarR family transcriptional regulator
MYRQGMDAGELYRLGRALQALAVQAMVDPDEVATAAEIMVVNDVSDHPGTTITAIAERSGFSQAAVSKTVAALVAAGVAAAAPDPRDRRRTTVTMEPAAMAMLRSRGRRSALDGLQEHGLSRADAAALLASADELAAVLERNDRMRGRARRED